MTLDDEYWSKGQAIIGVDEVGRGPLAGPTVTAAVILNPFDLPSRIKDSKKIKSRNMMRSLALEIRKRSVMYAITMREVWFINEHGINNAVFAAMRSAIKRCVDPNTAVVVLVDGNLKIPELKFKQRTIPKGDSKSLSIGAASILAKSFHDALMEKLGSIYPEYGFERHVGYYSKQHIEAIKKHGMVDGVHRTQFVRTALGG